MAQAHSTFASETNENSNTMDNLYNVLNVCVYALVVIPYLLWSGISIVGVIKSIKNEK